MQRDKDMSSKSVAILVLNWNGVDLLRQFMGNWVALTPSYAELIIVDNGSTDDSLAYLKANYPQVKCLSLGDNYGFAEGYNRAIEQLDYPIVVLLNSDVALSEAWLDEAFHTLQNDAEVVALQPKIRSYRHPQDFEYAGAAGGYIDALGYPYCAGRLFETVEQDMGQYDSSSDLAWASGACLIIRRASYLAVGGLDADFFAHQEEIDLCWRLRARGGKIRLLPRAVVYHVGGASLSSANPRKTYLNFRNNLLMLYKNLPFRVLISILALRMMLDSLAAIYYLFSRQRGHAWAVVRAWVAALVSLSHFREKRKANLSLAVVPYRSICSPLSVVWQYYVLGRKRYQDLK